MQLDQPLAFQLLQHAVHVHHAEPEDVGENFLSQGQRETPVLAQADAKGPLLQFQEQVADPLVGGLPSQADDLVEYAQLLHPGHRGEGCGDGVVLPIRVGKAAA